jgi:hypothetical protein
MTNQSKSLDFPGFLHGIATAVHPPVVAGLRTRLSALTLVVAIMATVTGSAFARDRHPACEAKQHDCGQLAKIANCCCGDLGAPRDAGTPAQSRTDVASSLATAPVPPQFEDPIPRSHASIAVQASPPRLALLDLNTLFACLLI